MRKEERPIHIVPRDGQWAITREGSMRASRIAPTKAIARKFASQLSKKQASIFVHNTDGTISEAFTPTQHHKASMKDLKTATSKRVHVTPQDDGWNVKKENDVKASKVFTSKYGAIRHAHKLAESAQAAMVVHDKDGRINHVDLPPHYRSMLADATHLR